VQFYVSFYTRGSVHTVQFYVSFYTRGSVHTTQFYVSFNPPTKNSYVNNIQNESKIIPTLRRKNIYNQQTTVVGDYGLVFNLIYVLNFNVFSFLKCFVQTYNINIYKLNYGVFSIVFYYYYFIVAIVKAGGRDNNWKEL
jgi:hypothetical protein